MILSRLQKILARRKAVCPGKAEKAPVKKAAKKKTVKKAVKSTTEEN